MQHVAIDLGGRESQVCARAPDGSIVNRQVMSTWSPGWTMSPFCGFIITIFGFWRTWADAIWGIATIGHKRNAVTSTLQASLAIFTSTSQTS